MFKRLGILMISAAVLVVAGCSGDNATIDAPTAADAYSGEFSGTYTLPGQRDTTKDVIMTIHNNGDIRGATDDGGGFTGTVNRTTGAYTIRFILPGLEPFTDTGTLTVQPDGSLRGTGSATPVVGQPAQTTSFDVIE